MQPKQKRLHRISPYAYVFLPPYSPDLNPIESIWKSIKKVISREFIKDVDHLKFIIKRTFEVFPQDLVLPEDGLKSFLVITLICWVLNYNSQPQSFL